MRPSMRNCQSCSAVSFLTWKARRWRVPAIRRAEASELLATAYQACSAALAKLGEPEAAWIAADRAMDAAERAGNPCSSRPGRSGLCSCSSLRATMTRPMRRPGEPP